MIRRELLKSGAIVGTSFLTAGCASSSGDSPSTEGGSSYTQTPEPCGDESEYVSCNGELKLISENVEQRGDEVWATGEIKNILGKPAEQVSVLVEFNDETGQHIKTITDRIHAFFHGEVWEYEIPMNGSLNEKRAISTWSSKIKGGKFLDTRIPTNHPESCGDVSEWQCDGRVKVASINEGWVTTEDHGEEYMVYGEIENIGEEEIQAVFLAANYLESGNKIVNSRQGTDDVGSYIPPGETNEFRMSFGNDVPSGDLSLRMYKTCTSVDECF